MKFAAKSVFLSLALAAALTHAQTKFNTPIQHVLIIVQENRSPDNLFQDPVLMNNGADISKFSDAVAASLGSCWDIGHGHASWEKEYTDQQNGAGFCNDNIDHGKCTSYPSCAPDTFVQNTSQDKTIQPYWDIAENYGFANYMFQSNQSHSFGAHQFLFGGTSAPVAYPTTFYEHFASENEAHGHNHNVGCEATSDSQVMDIDAYGEEDFDYSYNGMLGYPCYEHGTLSDLTEAAHLKNPWRYYGQTPLYPNTIWTAPAAIQHICNGSPNGQECPGSDFTKHVDLTDTDIFGDIANCNLAAVSWVIPDGHFSDHPGDVNGKGGPDWVASIVGAVGNNLQCDSGNPHPGYWNDTAILIIWDDWGGFYDHVPPYEVLVDKPGTWGSGFVAGFRVPLLVVSAYTPKGYISGRCVPSTDGVNNNDVCLNDKPPYQHDAGSILNFTEYVLGLPQGGISTACLPNKNWCFDDYWAPDYCGNPANNCDPHQYPYSLSDFFNFTQSPRAFTPVQSLTYHTAQDFINLVGGQPEDPDEETP